MINIDLHQFNKITGADFHYFSKNVFLGDDWGSFLKIVCLVESSSKRAIGLKLNEDLNSKKIINRKFDLALKYCRDNKIIYEHAYQFSDNIRKARNDLVHKGGVFDLDIEKICGSNFCQKYKSSLNNFVLIEGINLQLGSKHHLETLLLACIVYVGLIAGSLFNEDWFDGEYKQSLIASC